MAASVIKHVKSNVSTNESVYRMDAGLSSFIHGLMDADAEKRLLSTRKIVDYFANVEDKVADDDLSPDLERTLRRLVRGLASSKNMTRPGFSTALSQILREYPKVSVGKLVELMNNELKVNTSDPRGEQGQTLIGQVMVYMALIQTGRLRKANENEVETVVTGLRNLMKKKSYVEHICSHGLAMVISQVSGKIFSKIVYECLEDELTSGWEGCSPNKLLLLLHAAKSQPGKINGKFLTKHWRVKTLICDDSLHKLADIVMHSTLLHPVIHPVVTAVFDQVLHDDHLLGVLWQAMVTEKFTSSSPGKRYLIFHLLHYAFTTMTSQSSLLTSSRLRILFSGSVMSVMMKAVASKNDLFHNVARKALTAVCDCAKQSAAQLGLMEVLTSRHGSILFDSITHTQTLTNLVHQLSEKDALTYFTICLDHLHCDKSDRSSLSNDVRQRLAIHHLSRLAACPSLHQKPLQTKIVKLLFLHSFFNVIKASERVEHCDRGPLSAVPDKSVVDLMQTTFIKTVDHVTSSKQSQREGGVAPDHMSRLNFEAMLNLVNYAQLLLDSGDVVTLKQDGGDTFCQSWAALKSAIDTLEKKPNKSHEDIAFLHLYLQFSHQLFSDVTATNDVLDDLLQCHKKLNTKHRKSVCKVDTEPEWVEVMTDLFLQLLSRNSHLTRKIVNVSYSLLAPHCTQTSVNLILDVLKSEGGDDDVVDFEDDSDEETEEAENVKEMEVNDEENVKSDEDDEDDASSDEEDLEDAEEAVVNEALKLALEQVLGEAKSNSDEEESESDLSDSEMFKLDEALGKAFKGHLSKKKAEKDQVQQFMHFKIRLLGLITANIRHTHMNEPLILDILTTLIHLLVTVSRQKELKQLVTKTSEVVSSLCKIRKVDIDHGSRDVCRHVDTLKEFLKTSQKELAVSEDIKMACIFLVRLCTMDHNHTSPARTRASRNKAENEHRTTGDLCQAVQDLLRTLLSEHFYKRDTTHLDIGIYTHLFTGQTDFMVPLLSDLVKVIDDSSLRIFCRSQACAMLNVTLTKKLPEDTRVDWEDFGPKLHSAVEKMLTALLEGSLKPKVVQVLLLCLNKYDLAFQQIVTQKDLESQERLLVSIRETKTKKKDVRKGVAALQNVINRVKKTFSGSADSKPARQDGGARKRTASKSENGDGEQSIEISNSPSPKKIFNKTKEVSAE